MKGEYILKSYEPNTLPPGATINPTPYLNKDFGSIWDMMAYAYGPLGSPDYIRKDSEIDIDTTGARNIIYGAKLWWEVCVAANTFGCLPKKPYEKSGYRMVTAAGSTATAGLAENAAPPATAQPTVVEIGDRPRLACAGWEMSVEMLYTQGKDDNATWEEYAKYEEQEFKNRLNVDLLADGNTTKTYGLESLDIIIASSLEVDDSLYDANDVDVYAYGSSSSLDRDSITTYDAYVSHNAGTDRNVSLSIVDSLFTNTRPYWLNPASVENKVMVTGFDVAERLEQLIYSQVRYGAAPKVQFGVNGIQTLPGAEAGLDVCSYKGVPIIPDKNTPQDTVSRIYLIDMDHLWIAVAVPVSYFETPDFTGHDKFTKQAYYWMLGQTWATGFHCHGKGRDMK